MNIVGLDVGSTTVKALIYDGAVRWQHYARHNTKQAEMVLEFLARMETECGLAPGRDRIYITGSGAGLLAPLIGAKMGDVIGDAQHPAAAVDAFRHPQPAAIGQVRLEGPERHLAPPRLRRNDPGLEIGSADDGATACRMIAAHQVRPERGFVVIDKERGTKCPVGIPEPIIMIVKRNQDCCIVPQRGKPGRYVIHRTLSELQLSWRIDHEAIPFQDSADRVVFAAHIGQMVKIV